MSRRVLARIKVMVVTVMFIGGFSAFNPACSQETHASDIDDRDVEPAQSARTVIR